MSIALERAKSSWLLAFGDVITLLITFFIMMIVLNKGEINKVQKWVDQQITQSYQVLHDEVIQQDIQVIKVARNAEGILLTVQGNQAFEPGSTEPTLQLKNALAIIGKMLSKTPLLNIEQNPKNLAIIQQANKDGMQWLAEVSIEGHTDNDFVDPLSRLRNNFFLSTLRAQAVMQILYQSSALPANIFSVTGYGQWQPITSNETEAGKRQNRRVEVLISASFQKKGTQFK